MDRFIEKPPGDNGLINGGFFVVNPKAIDRIEGDLTVWEQELRQLAGQGAYGESFIEHWLSRLLYWDLPGWVFVAAYTGFAGLVAGAWWWVRTDQ